MTGQKKKRVQCYHLDKERKRDTVSSLVLQPNKHECAIWQVDADKIYILSILSIIAYFLIYALETMSYVKSRGEGSEDPRVG